MLSFNESKRFMISTLLVYISFGSSNKYVQRISSKYAPFSLTCISNKTDRIIIYIFVSFLRNPIFYIFPHFSFCIVAIMKKIFLTVWLHISNWIKWTVYDKYNHLLVPRILRIYFKTFCQVKYWSSPNYKPNLFHTMGKLRVLKFTNEYCLWASWDIW